MLPEFTRMDGVFEKKIKSIDNILGVVFIGQTEVVLPRHPLFLHSDQSVQGRLQWPLVCMQAEEIPAASAGKFQLAEETKEDPTDTLSFFPHLWFPHDSSCTGSVGATCKIATNVSVTKLWPGPHHSPYTCSFLCDFSFLLFFPDFSWC